MTEILGLATAAVTLAAAIINLIAIIPSKGRGKHRK